MTTEDMKKATIDDAKELAPLANQLDIDVTVHDHETASRDIAEIVSDMMIKDGVDMLSSFINAVEESDTQFAEADEYGIMEAFGQTAPDNTEEKLYVDLVLPDGIKILEGIEEVKEQEYTFDGVCKPCEILSAI